MRHRGVSLRADQREWERLARLDPMWAVVSTPGKQGAWSAEEFFRSGEEEIAGILAMLEWLRVACSSGRVLDFGCGLGRLTRALGERFDEAWGVDISHEMVEQAKTLNRDRGPLRFLVNSHPDLRDLPSSSFDLVLSLITLQHVSSTFAIRSYIREFVRVAAPNGVLVFQVPAHVNWRVRFGPRQIARRLRFQRLTGSPTLTAIAEQQVRDLLTESGAQVIAALPDNRVGSDAVRSLCYVARATGAGAAPDA